MATDPRSGQIIKLVSEVILDNFVNGVEVLPRVLRCVVDPQNLGDGFITLGQGNDCREGLGLLGLLCRSCATDGNHTTCKHVCTGAGRGGSCWLDSFCQFISGAWRMADYAAVRRVARLSEYTWSGVWPSSA